MWEIASDLDATGTQGGSECNIDKISPLLVIINPMFISIV